MYAIYHLLGADVILAWSIPDYVPFIKLAGWFLFAMTYMLTINSIIEELVFRAFPLFQFDDLKISRIYIIVFVSILFSAVHFLLEPFNWGAFFSRTITAILFCVAFDHWRSIWLVTGMHNGVNFVGFFLSGNHELGGLMRSTIENGLPDYARLIVKLVISVIIILVFYAVAKWQQKTGKELLGLTCHQQV